MGNKLRDIFQNDEPVFGGEFSFADDETRNRFAEAMQKLQNEGGSYRVGDGVSFKTSLKNGKNSSEKYVFHEGEMKDLVIYSEPEMFPIDVEIDQEKRQIKCLRTKINSGLIISAPKNSVVDFKIRLNFDKHMMELSVTPQFECAKCSSDVIDAYKIVDSVFRKFLLTEEEILDLPEKQNKQRKKDVDQIVSLLKRIKQEIRIFEIVFLIEEKLDMKFDITQFARKTEYLQDVEELYFALIKKLPIRLNAKVTPSDTNGINVNWKDKDLIVGSQINITFGNKIIYNVCGTEIIFFTANMLSNAAVKKILPQENGQTKVILGDDDVCPMYVSYKIYTKKEEAQSEVDSMIERKEEYIHAKTVYEYVLENGLD